MKKNLKNISTIIALVFGLNAVAFATEINSSIVLNSKSEFAFVNYLQLNAQSVIDNNDADIKAFNNVVALYNSSTSEFLKYDELDRSRFTAASNKILADLAKLNTPEANMWARKINTTTKVLNFIWSLDISTDINIEKVELPVIM